MYRDIDTMLLIRLVQNRPVLWDKKLVYYRFKQAHAIAWKEIYMKLHDGYESLTEIEKRDFGKLVINRWNNVRDNWIRCHKKLIDYKAGDGEKVKKYKFYEPMKFLAKIVNYRASEVSLLSVDESSKDSKNGIEECEIPKKKRNTKTKFAAVATEETEPKTAPTRSESVDQEEKIIGDSRVMYFFKSIAPTVEKYDDDDLIEFQFEVVRTMREINRKARLSQMNVDLVVDEDQKNIITFENGDYEVK